MDAIRLYVNYAAISLRSQLQYRASFVMMALGNFGITGIEILAIWALFARFKGLAGWSLPEVGLLYGMVNTAFALAEGAGRGFDVFPRLVKSGDFDRLLLRPRSTALQVAAQEIQLMRVGRLAQGAIVLTWSLAQLPTARTPAGILLTLLAIAGGACLFYGLFVIQATCAFWTTESLELMNTVTYGGTEAGSYPLPIYRGWFRSLFIFVVPLALVTYFPGLAVLGRDDALLRTGRAFQCLAPLAGVAFLWLSLQLWRIGVRHYASTGS